MYSKTNQQIIDENRKASDIDQLKLWNKCNPEFQINEKGERLWANKKQN